MLSDFLVYEAAYSECCTKYRNGKLGGRKKVWQWYTSTFMFYSTVEVADSKTTKLRKKSFISKTKNRHSVYLVYFFIVFIKVSTFHISLLAFPPTPHNLPLLLLWINLLVWETKHIIIDGLI